MPNWIIRNPFSTKKNPGLTEIVLSGFDCICGKVGHIARNCNAKTAVAYSQKGAAMVVDNENS